MLAGVVALLAVVWFFVRPDQAVTDQLLKQARSSIERGDLAACEGLSRQVLQRDPESRPALLLLAQCLAGRERWDEAEACLRQIPSTGPFSIEARSLTGRLLLEAGRPSAAEAAYREVIRIAPDNDEAHLQLATILANEGRFWEAQQHQLHRLKRGRFPLTHLFWMAQPTASLGEAGHERLAAWRQSAPDDLAPLIGLARIRRGENKTGEAEELLRQVAAGKPELLDAHVGLGLLFIDSERVAEFLDWHAQLPSTADTHPDIWVARGLAYRRLDQPRAAARCFVKAVRLDPTHRIAVYQAGRSLAALGEQTLAEPFLNRAGLLSQLAVTIELLVDDQSNLRLVRSAAHLTESLGRLWESLGWYHYARALGRQPDWAVTGSARAAKRLSMESPRTVSTENPGQSFDVSDFPLPSFQDLDRGTPAVVEQTESVIRFENVAEAAGIEFRYENDHDSAKAAMRMQEFTGGGTAVIDFNGDGWPDLYATQGCHWPPGSDQEHTDRLYRNLGDGRFADVTRSAGLLEFGYSQGATVGDFDNDGFPDLYVGNVGANRLFRNNGDGTFADVTEFSGAGGDEWTTSCLIADLNGDTLPDVYAVNYLGSNDVFSRICKDDRGIERSCKPFLFLAAQDRMYLNSGDGRFQDCTEVAGFVVPNGRGLGIVAADLSGSGQLDLFVANDGEPNFLFRNETPQRGEKPRFAEQGVWSGLAYERDGRAQATMGVATGDTNGDGCIDLFVTNYYEDSNILYVQTDQGLFFDRTREAALRDPGFLMLGFGTQFLDADLDGRQDLIVTNGHEGDYSDLGEPFQMPPQFFHNVGSGKFVELSPDTLGPFFCGKYLGRGLAKLDWNRDGREDFVVSHLDAPLALCSNQTENANHSLTVHLRGTRSDRDAIGTQVTITVGDKTLSRSLTAGDGYLASNQRILLFGLGTQSQVDTLTVRWPSGMVDRFSNIAADRELLLREGAGLQILAP